MCIPHVRVGPTCHLRCFSVPAANMRMTLALLLFAGAEAIPTKKQLSLGPSKLETQSGGQTHPEPGMDSSGHSSTTTLSDDLKANFITEIGTAIAEIQDCTNKAKVTSATDISSVKTRVETGARHAGLHHPDPTPQLRPSILPAQRT